MSQQPDTIITLLNQQQAQLDALLLLLSNELTALTQRDAAQLDLLVEQKSDLLQKIATLDQTLAQFPELASFRSQDWFIEQVTQMDKTLAACKQQTQVNQQVVEQSQLTLQRLKNELLGAQGKSG
ncbi:MAG: flagellar biosynthesis protein FlgN, partial [Alishewanella sp. 32-51-5]